MCTPRHPRIHGPGLPYHLLARGNSGQAALRPGVPRQRLLLLHREPFHFDFERVVDEAVRRGVRLEINASPRKTARVPWRPSVTSTRDGPSPCSYIHHRPSGRGPLDREVGRR